ncbi:MAG: hypothetical protein AB9836_04555 [Aminipila sp.]
MAKGENRSAKSRLLPKEIAKKIRIKQESDGKDLLASNSIQRKLLECIWYQELDTIAKSDKLTEVSKLAKGYYDVHKGRAYPEEQANKCNCMCNSILLRLTEILTAEELCSFIKIIPYIYSHDGTLRDKDGIYIQLRDLCDILRKQPSTVRNFLNKLQKNKVIFKLFPKANTPKDNILIPLFFKAESLDYIRTLVIYINPYIVFKEQYIDIGIMPYFNNSEWYVINPYGTNIKDWVLDNCK